MRKSSLDLLCALERIGDDHADLYDSEVRERIGEAVMQGFVRRLPDYEVPADLGLHEPDANDEVRALIVRHIDAANSIAVESGIIAFHERLEQFQNSDVVTPAGNDYDEFFGHTPPEWYDSAGNVRSDQVR